MKTVGIITHYYNNMNYGGVLQSYALVKALENTGYEALQIKFVNNKISNNYYMRLKDYTIKEIGAKIYNRLLRKVSHIIDGKLYKKEKTYLIMKQRKFEDFIENIPHTDLYDNSSISKIGNSFDYYITGSDQVWNMDLESSAYFLQFTKRKRIAYAASMGNYNLSKRKQRLFEKYISSFDDITVREYGARNYIDNKCNIDAKVVLDPVFLLSANEWEEVAESSNEEKKYIFCYLLGKNKKVQNKISKISKDLNLPIVYLAYSQTEQLYKDYNFGDDIRKTVGPKEFVGLISNAAYVVTDSFHACVFSLIFQKKFWVFPRYYMGGRKDTDRMINVLDEFQISNRFVEYNSFRHWDEEIGWKDVNRILDSKRKESLLCLKDMLS